MEKKIDEVKLSLNEMEDVSGGTRTECWDIADAISEAHAKGLHKSADWTNPLWGLGDRAEHNLANLGIECHSSTGVWGGGAGSVNNTYRDMKTGQYLLHEEVLDYIRTGNKSWIK